MRFLSSTFICGMLLAAHQFAQVAEAQLISVPVYSSEGVSSAGTAAGSASSGFADVISASGEYNLKNSQAAINNEEARSKYFDNRLKWTKTYFEMRKLNKAYRDEERGPAPTSAQIHRWAKQRAPKRMSETQMDTLTGELNWPLILKLDVFEENRLKLEELCAERAKTSGTADPNTYLEIKQVTKEMQSDLKKHGTQFSGNDYADARNFLESLAYEARFSKA